MSFVELIDKLNAKLGVEIEDAGGAAALQIDGHTIILQQASDDLVLLRTDLGEIPHSRRDALAYAALEANFLYKGTGGATLAINPADAHLHLQKYNWLDRLDVDDAFEMLLGFADSAAAWKRLIHEAPPPSNDISMHGYFSESVVHV